MANTFISSYHHIIFSTKKREPFITPPISERLWRYLAGIAQQNKCKALIVGGTMDHVHILISLPASISIAYAVQQIKGVSSQWVSNTFPRMQDFAWQVGYSAFSIRASDCMKTTQYIQNQDDHHKIKSFKDEYLHFLKLNGVEYDERYVFD